MRRIDKRAFWALIKEKPGKAFHLENAIITDEINFDDLRGAHEVGAYDFYNVVFEQNFFHRTSGQEFSFAFRNCICKGDVTLDFASSNSIPTTLIIRNVRFERNLHISPREMKEVVLDKVSVFGNILVCRDPYGGQNQTIRQLVVSRLMMRHRNKWSTFKIEDVVIKNLEIGYSDISGFQVSGCKFLGDVNIQKAYFKVADNEAFFDKCSFEDRVSCIQTNVHKDLTISNVYLKRRLYFT